MKRKKINRKYLALVFCGVIVTLVAMSVVYAALASTLTIMGSAEVKSSSFELKIEKVNINDVFNGIFKTACQSSNGVCEDNYLMFGNAKILSSPTISGTLINNFKMSVELPGDQVMMFYNATNTGTIPMKLSNIIVGDIQYNSLNNSDSDVEWAINNVDLILDLNNQNFNSLNINDILCPGETAVLVINVSISDTVDSIPSRGIDISNISVAYDFVQTDQYLCE